jgi:cyclopropane fatty-acyl-phospholipid synthase-like methyltransferase
MNKPFWEESYLKDDISTFGIEPNVTIKEFLNLYHKDWNILDVGCGEGKNDVFLAKQGFQNIDAFDISEAGIEKLKRIAKINEVGINAWVQDLCHFDFSKKYDLLMSHGTLHFVTKDDWYKFIIKAKEYTNKNGIHIIQIFTNKLPASPDIAPFVKGLSDEGELEIIYQDWEIIQFKSYTFEDEHPGAPKHYHAANKIVARKLKD